LAYIICEPCVDVLDRACVEECPVDCIYEYGNQLWIHPQECVDCDACMPACPVDAIFPQDDTPAEWKQFIQMAIDFFNEHPDASGGASQSPYAPKMEG
jgi:Fe-S-cluster-containing hydrogenase component 2